MFALKTNLLYDVVLAPNIEFEFPFAKDRFSVMGEFWCPWWCDNDDAWCYELLYGGIEGRWWFQDRTGRDALTGHFVGLYAGGGYYDFEWKSKGYQGEFMVAAGISYGYSFKLSDRMRLETSLGVGFMRTDYRHYIGMEDNEFLVWQYDGIYTWVGPTKAKVSLVWMIGGNNHRKGGRL